MVNSHYRLICVVPMVGSGTRADPHRPAYVPLPTADGRALPRSGIIGFGFLPSDDKKSAIVEFVAVDPTVFNTILADKSVIALEKGKSKRADIEAQGRKYKKDFSLDQLLVAVP